MFAEMKQHVREDDLRAFEGFVEAPRHIFRGEK
jgi:hypothetical protein